MKITKYYIVHFAPCWYKTEPYLIDGQRLEYDSPDEARAKIKELEDNHKERTGNTKLWAWKKEEIEV